MSQAAPTYASFIAAYPVFMPLPEAMVTAQINGSALMLDAGSWGQFYTYAVMLDAAHKLVLNAMAMQNIPAAFQAAIGQIIAASGAGISTSFSGPRSNLKGYAEQFYSSTSYGKEFLMLQNRVITCIAGTNDDDFEFVDVGLDMPLLP